MKETQKENILIECRKIKMTCSVLAAEVWAQSSSVSGNGGKCSQFTPPECELPLNFASRRGNFERETQQHDISYAANHQRPEVPLPARLGITYGALTSHRLKRHETLSDFPATAKVPGFFYNSWHNLLADQCSNASTSASQQSLRDSASAAILQCQVLLALDVRRLYRSDESD